MPQRDPAEPCETIAGVNLLLIEADEFGPDGLVELTGPRARHLTDVLKVVVGQQVRAGVVDGPVGTGQVVHLADGVVTLRCSAGPPPGRQPLDLLLALPRPKVLRRLWPQLAALGVGRIMLTNAARVERHYFDTHVLDPRHVRPLLLEGLAQARDTRLPLVTVHRRFRPFVEDELDTLSDASCRLVADPAADTRVADAVQGSIPGRVLLAVGPEGGWTAFELGLLAGRGCRPVGLGARTLRSDTACVALLALVHDALRGTTRDTGLEAR